MKVHGGGRRRRRLELIAMGAGLALIFSTACSSGESGADIELGNDCSINGSHTDSLFGVPRPSVHDGEYIQGRAVGCDDDRECPDGTQPVLCFANPCDVTPACEQAVRCEANYCGGCNAEFFDENGARVCLPDATGECSSDADCVQTGCSGQICAAQDVITTCVFRDEFACFQDPAITTCGCAAGHCTFAATPQLNECLESAASSGG